MTWLLDLRARRRDLILRRQPFPLYRWKPMLRLDLRLGAAGILMRGRIRRHERKMSERRAR